MSRRLFVAVDHILLAQPLEQRVDRVVDALERGLLLRLVRTDLDRLGLDDVLARRQLGDDVVDRQTILLGGTYVLPEPLQLGLVHVGDGHVLCAALRLFKPVDDAVDLCLALGKRRFELVQLALDAVDVLLHLLDVGLRGRKFDAQAGQLVRVSVARPLLFFKLLAMLRRRVVRLRTRARNVALALVDLAQIEIDRLDLSLQDLDDGLVVVDRGGQFVYLRGDVFEPLVLFRERDFRRLDVRLVFIELRFVFSQIVEIVFEHALERFLFLLLLLDLFVRLGDVALRFETIRARRGRSARDRARRREHLAAQRDHPHEVGILAVDRDRIVVGVDNDRPAQQTADHVRVLGVVLDQAARDPETASLVQDRRLIGAQLSRLARRQRVERRAPQPACAHEIYQYLGVRRIARDHVVQRAAQRRGDRLAVLLGHRDDVADQSHDLGCDRGHAPRRAHQLASRRKAQLVDRLRPAVHRGDVLLEHIDASALVVDVQVEFCDLVGDLVLVALQLVQLRALFGDGLLEPTLFGALFVERVLERSDLLFHLLNARFGAFALRAQLALVRLDVGYARHRVEHGAVRRLYLVFARGDLGDERVVSALFALDLARQLILVLVRHREMVHEVGEFFLFLLDLTFERDGARLFLFFALLIVLDALAERIALAEHLLLLDRKFGQFVAHLAYQDVGVVPVGGL